MRPYMIKSPNVAPKRKDHCYLSKSNWINKHRFLQEVGYEDIFNSEEINEIKELYDKA